MIFTVLRKFLEMGRLHSSQKYFWSTYLSQMTTCLMGQERTPPVAKLREGHTMEFAHKNPTNNYPLWFYWFRVANESSFISLLRSTPLPKPDLIRYQKYPKLMVFDSKTYLLSICFFLAYIHVSFRGCTRIFQPIFLCFSRNFPAAYLQIHIELHPTATTWKILKGNTTVIFFAEENDVQLGFFGSIPLWIPDGILTQHKWWFDTKI